MVVCDQWLGSNGYAGMKALRRAGWSVEVVPEWELVPVQWKSTAMRAVGRLLRGAAVREFNDALLRRASYLAPDILLVFKGTFVRQDALRALRERGVRCYCFYPDVSFTVHGPYLPQALPEYDWVFCTKRFGIRDMADRLGMRRASLLPHAYDPDLHRPVEISSEDERRYGCDVSFIGTWSPKKERTLRELVRQLPDARVRVWGNQWPRVGAGDVLAPAIAGHEAAGEEYVRAIRASAVNLGLLSERRPGASDDDRITSRTFHIPACGSFMLHERTDELLEIFEENISVACFADVDELVAQVRRFLSDTPARERIARAGGDVVRAGHSWDHRIAAILERHEALPA
jgi:hypothetical protein